jgi:hypothetical protein
MTCQICDAFEKWIARLAVSSDLDPLSDEERAALVAFLRDEQDAHGDRDSAALFR